MRVIYCLFIVGLLTLALYVAVWSMRPVWHIHILHLGTPSEVSLAVQYPDGWKIREVNDDYRPSGILTPIAPSGLMGWWTKYILKVDPATQENNSITVAVQVPASMSSVDVEKRYSHARKMLMNALGRAYKSVTCASIDRDGIKGFDVEAHQALRPALNKRCMRMLLLYQLNQKNDPKSSDPIGFELRIYMTEENYRSLKPTINEIIRRLRLVEYNRVSPSN